MIRKKDMKIEEISKILEEEVNPQLEQLRREKDDYALWRSNESQAEEYGKLLVAWEYWENLKFMDTGDQEICSRRDKLKKLEGEVRDKERDVELKRSKVLEMERDSGQGKKEEGLKKRIREVENEGLTMDLDGDKMRREEEAWREVRTGWQRQLEGLEKEVERKGRRVREMEGEVLEQKEKELGKKKDELWNLEQALKKGADKSDREVTVARAVQEAVLNLQTQRDKKKAIENEIKLMGSKLNEAKNDMKNREREQTNYEQDKQNIMGKIQKAQGMIEARKGEVMDYQGVLKEKRGVETKIEDLEKELQHNNMQNIGNFVEFRYRVPYP